MAIQKYNPKTKYRNGSKVDCYGTICVHKPLGGCSTCFLAYKPIDRRNRIKKKCNAHCTGVDMCFVSLPQEQQSYGETWTFQVGKK